MNKVLGVCNCPLPWCGEAGAEVREGEKGKLYVICDACVSMVRTQSRKGQAGMRAAATPAPAPKPADTPPAPPAAKPAKPSRPFGFA